MNGIYWTEILVDRKPAGCLAAPYRLSYPVPEDPKGWAILFADGVHTFAALLEPTEERLDAFLTEVVQGWTLEGHSSFGFKATLLRLTPEAMARVREEVEASLEDSRSRRSPWDVPVPEREEALRFAAQALEGIPREGDIVERASFTLNASPERLTLPVRASGEYLRAEGGLSLYPDGGGEWLVALVPGPKAVAKAKVPELCGPDPKGRVEGLLENLLEAMEATGEEGGWILLTDKPQGAEEELSVLLRHGDREGWILKVE